MSHEATGRALPLGEDPAYLAALEQARKSSVLATHSRTLVASSGTHSQLSPPPPPPLHVRPEVHPSSSSGVSVAQVGRVGAPSATVGGSFKKLSLAEDRRPASSEKTSRAPVILASQTLEKRKKDGSKVDGSGQGAQHSAVPPPPSLIQNQKHKGSISSTARASNHSAVSSNVAVPTASGQMISTSTKTKASPSSSAMAASMPSAELQRAMKLGHVFRGTLRVNAGDPREAYVTVPGLPNDVMLRNGTESRGRSLEGDEVALRLQPLQLWFTQTNKAATGASTGAPQ